MAVTPSDLRKAEAAIERAREKRNGLIRRASQEGWSDADIGQAVGLTRMMVWKIRQNGNGASPQP